MVGDLSHQSEGWGLVPVGGESHPWRTMEKQTNVQKENPARLILCIRSSFLIIPLPQQH